MVIQSSGAISFDEIQTEFGGIYPISLNEYYQDANQAYTSGVTGIPNIGSAFSISEFYGKAKSSSKVVTVSVITGSTPSSKTNPQATLMIFCTTSQRYSARPSTSFVL